MKKPQTSNILTWFVIAVFIIWLFDFLRCKINWCPARFWRFNKPKKCEADTDCEHGYNCVDERCAQQCDGEEDCPDKDAFSCIDGVCLMTCVTKQDCLDGTECSGDGVCHNPSLSEAHLNFVKLNSQPKITMRRLNTQL
jgi:hypothetical protein